MKRIFSAILLAPSTASACAVCFGGLDSSGGTARGLWWGIVLLLGTTMSLVAAIGWAAWTVEKQREGRTS
jgi:hypothetical protein